jgi:glycolate dehydrogenase FAD-binding subunit
MAREEADMLMLAELTTLLPGTEARGRPQTDVAGVSALVEVRPTSLGELEQTVRWASGRSLALAALGGTTKLGVGNPPSRLDLLLDVSGLDSVIEYDPQDLVLTAQAGVTVQQVQTLVGKDSLVLPLDPQSPERATLGGVIACADHGPRRRQYGGLRDVVLGLKAVLADGSLVSFGGRTLKNVAGYDVGKVFIGSLGTIGVIAETTVRLLPRPAAEELLLIPLARLISARRLATRILASPLLPSSLELMSPRCAELLHLERSPSSGSGYLMIIGVEGHAAAVERQVRDVVAFCAGLDSEETTACPVSDLAMAPADVWAAFSQIRQRALADGSFAGFRCSVPLVPSWDVAQAVEEHAGVNDVEASYRLGCGTGHLEVYATGTPVGLRTFAEGVRSEAERLGGALSVLDGWSALGREFDAWGTSRGEYRLMQAVKQRFDPEGIMNPGRFVGGL